MKAVIDTNVYVSMLLSPRGAGAWLMALWRDNKFEVVISSSLYEELVEVLQRPHLNPKIDSNRRFALLRRIQQDALWTPGELDTPGILPDAGDDLLLSAAWETNAPFILTWDAALLGSYRGVQIVTPDTFISIVIR